MIIIPFIFWDVLLPAMLGIASKVPQKKDITTKQTIPLVDSPNSGKKQIFTIFKQLI
jgi:hypothetical protein